MEEKTSNGLLESGRPQRPIEEAISELERELLVRKRCYQGWIKDGKMTRVDAVDRYERHETALRCLQELAGATSTDEARDAGTTDAPLPF